jgi:hypothetical protein
MILPAGLPGHMGIYGFTAAAVRIAFRWVSRTMARNQSIKNSSKKWRKR